MSNDVLVKFAGGQCEATSCGSQNPLAAMMASTLLQEMNSFNVAQTQTQETQNLQAQNFGAMLAAGGFQIG